VDTVEQFTLDASSRAASAALASNDQPTPVSASGA